MLRKWFESEEQEGAELSRFLIEQILDTGLEPVEPPPLLPPIAPEDIVLLCWMGIEAEGSVSEGFCGAHGKPDRGPKKLK